MDPVNTDLSRYLSEMEYYEDRESLLEELREDRLYLLTNSHDGIMEVIEDLLCESSSIEELLADIFLSQPRYGSKRIRSLIESHASKMARGYAIKESKRLKSQADDIIRTSFYCGM